MVIERMLGTEVETLYALSRRSDPRDALCDLRSREGTTLQKIGFADLATDKPHSRDAEVTKIIKDWATQRSIQVVVWTDLESNFQKWLDSVHFNKDVTCDKCHGGNPDGTTKELAHVGVILRVTGEAVLRNAFEFSLGVTLLAGDGGMFAQ